MKNWIIGIGIIAAVIGLFVVPGVQSLGYHTGHGIQLEDVCGDDDSETGKFNCVSSSYHNHDCTLDDFSGWTEYKDNNRYAFAICGGDVITCSGTWKAIAEKNGEVKCWDHGDTFPYRVTC